MTQPRLWSPDYKPHPAQKIFHDDNHRFRVISAGRRWGKTTASIWEFYRLLVESPEEHPVGWVVAPNYPLSIIDWDAMTDMFGAIIVNQNAQDHWMELYIATKEWGRPRTAKVEFKTAEREDRALRGRGLSALLVDEAAMVGRKAWEQGLKPALLDKRGWGIFISTPNGRNLFYELFMMGVEGSSTHDEEWKSFQFPTDSNPYIPRTDFEKERLTTPSDIFKAEYLAEFLEDESAVFHGLSKIASGQLGEPIEGRRYAIGADLARHNDFTALIAIDDTGQVTHVHRSREMEWPLQRKMIQAKWQKYPGIVWMDSSGQGDVIEGDVRTLGVAVRGIKTNSAIVKTELIEYLIVAIENGFIRIPSDKENPSIAWLWDELRMFERTKTPSEQSWKYSAPEGKHDDGVIALALAAWGMKGVLGRKKEESRKEDNPYTTWGQYRNVVKPLKQKPRSFVPGLRYPTLPAFRFKVRA